MTTASRLTSPKAFRLATLLAIAIGGATTALAAFTSDAVTAAIVALVALVGVVALGIGYIGSTRWTAAARTLAQLQQQIETNRRTSDELVGRVKRLEAEVSRQENHNSALVDRVQSLESAESRQENHNSALVDRVRSLESAESRQENHISALVDRVRSLESAESRQENHNSALVDRVRRVESALDDGLRDLFDTIVTKRNDRVHRHAEVELARAIRQLRATLKPPADQD